MGLDMTLYGTLDVYHMTDSASDVMDRISVEYDVRVHSVKAVVGSWRKANAIHRWFVEHVQDGKDDCHVYDVTHDQLRRLLDTIDDVLDHPERANEWLPTLDGFYYGSVAYDDEYFRMLDETSRILEQVLSEKMRGWEFTYQSSW